MQQQQIYKVLSYTMNVYPFIAMLLEETVHSGMFPHRLGALCKAQSNRGIEEKYKGAMSNR
jgi:hypothetical protein